MISETWTTSCAVASPATGSVCLVTYSDIARLIRFCSAPLRSAGLVRASDDELLLSLSTWAAHNSHAYDCMASWAKTCERRDLGGCSFDVGSPSITAERRLAAVFLAVKVASCEDVTRI